MPTCGGRRASPRSGPPRRHTRSALTEPGAFRAQRTAAIVARCVALNPLLSLCAAQVDDGEVEDEVFILPEEPATPTRAAHRSSARPASREAWTPSDGGDDDGIGRQEREERDSRAEALIDEVVRELDAEAAANAMAGRAALRGPAARWPVPELPAPAGAELYERKMDPRLDPEMSSVWRLISRPQTQNRGSARDDSATASSVSSNSSSRPSSRARAGRARVEDTGAGVFDERGD